MDSACEVQYAMYSKARARRARIYATGWVQQGAIDFELIPDANHFGSVFRIYSKLPALKSVKVELRSSNS